MRSDDWWSIKKVVFRVGNKSYLVNNFEELLDVNRPFGDSQFSSIYVYGMGQLTVSKRDVVAIIDPQTRAIDGYCHIYEMKLVGGLLC